MVKRNGQAGIVGIERPLFSQVELIGGATSAALYQQRPTAAEVEVFKPERWQRYSELPQFRHMVQRWDPP